MYFLFLVHLLVSLVASNRRESNDGSLGSATNSTRPHPKSVQTCYHRNHAWFELPDHCKGDLGLVENGCGFSSPLSKYSSVGYGVGQNTASSHSSGGLGTVVGLMSPIPGVHTGKVKDDDFKQFPCDDPVQWKDASEVCIRAVLNDVAVEFDKNRQWNMSQALAWIASSGHAFRNAVCEDKTLLSRDEVLVGSRMGGWVKTSNVCWDFVFAVKSVYCDAKKSDSEAPYRKLCSYTSKQWDVLAVKDVTGAFNELNKRKEGFMSKAGIRGLRRLEMQAAGTDRSRQRTNNTGRSRSRSRSRKPLPPQVAEA